MFQENDYTSDLERDGSASFIKRFWHNGKNKISHFWGDFGSYGKNKKIAVILGVIVAVIILAWAAGSMTSGETATLYLDPTSPTVTAGSEFNISVNVDTKNNNVVAVKSILEYNENDFELVNTDTSNSEFLEGSTCSYNSGPCQIINDTAGKLTVTLAKPSPGVNASNILIANLTFKAKKAIEPETDNMTLYYETVGAYTDSDVILEGDDGLDILEFVTNSRVTAILPAPTNLSGNGASATQIDLSWNSLENIGITKFEIYRNSQKIGESQTTSYSDTVGLAPDTSYSYQVKALDTENRESSLTSAVSVSTLPDTTAPTVPDDLSSSNVTMDSLDLSWNASTDNVGVSQYTIYRNGSFIDYGYCHNPTTPTCHDTLLSPDTEYIYTVVATDDALNASEASAEYRVTTSSDSIPPSIPTITSITATTTQITLTWHPSTDNVGVKGYKIYRTGSSTPIDTTGLTYTDSGLEPSTSYTYRVSAYDFKNNESEKSDPESATTNGDTQAPTAPTNLTSSNITMNSLTLSWSASSDNIGVTEYKVFRDGSETPIAQNLTTTNYNDSGLEINTSYNYTVRAYDAAGNQSAESNLLSVTTQNDTTPPSIPANLNASAVSMTQIDISWNASTDNVEVAEYRLYRGDDETPIAVIIDGTSYSDKELTQNTTYEYRISAVDTSGNESAKSDSISTTTLRRRYGISDFANLVADWLTTNPSSPANINDDAMVDSRDLGIMMSNWE